MGGYAQTVAPCPTLAQSRGPNSFHERSARARRVPPSQRGLFPVGKGRCVIPHVEGVRSRRSDDLQTAVPRCWRVEIDRSSILAVVSLLDAVTEQRVLIPDVEFAVRDHRMRPGRFVGALRLIEPSTLQVFLTAR